VPWAMRGAKQRRLPRRLAPGSDSKAPGSQRDESASGEGGKAARPVRELCLICMSGGDGVWHERCCCGSFLAVGKGTWGCVVMLGSAPVNVL
jgi:hypothetical protein